MNSIARRNKKSVSGQINILQQDILKNEIESNSADHVVSSFGLKTFNSSQLSKLAHELERILRPDGTYSFVEISVPNSSFLKFFYMFYLEKIIPILGYLFQGNSKDYKMLGTYTSKFGNSKGFHSMLIKEGLESHYEQLFFGCGSITWEKKKSN